MARQTTTTTPKADDLAEYQRFRDLAAELEAEDDEKATADAVRRLGKAHRPPKKPAKRVRHP
jgi:hypothetical protein